MLQFLNENAGVLNLLFTGVVALATVVYAVLTSRLVKETQRLREAATEPSLEVTYRSRDEAMALLEVVVKNIGSGPAYKISVSFTAEPPGPGADELLARLRKVQSFERGINILLPGQEFSSYWTDVRQNFQAKLATIVHANSVCRSATGQEYRRSHQIDLSELDGVERLGSPPLLSMARSLKSIQEDINKFSTGFRKLSVDTYSQADRDRIQADWEAHRDELIRESASQSDTNAPPATQ